MYDPLVDSAPPDDAYKPNSFWAADHTPNIYPQLAKDLCVDVAIIGGGYTGLSTALHMRKDYDIDCCIIEANQPGWGCSGRNGGFVLPGSGRLGIQQMAKKWGKTESRSIFAEFQHSIHVVDSLIESGIDCDKTSGGYLKLAHKPQLVSSLHKQAEIMNAEYGDNIKALSADQIANQYLAGAENFGGVYYPDAFSVNPWLLAQGIAQQAHRADVPIFGNSPVLNAHFDGSAHTLRTANSTIKAKHLVIASNAYGQRHLFSQFTDRTFPVISSIVVTAPLSPDQLQSISMKAGLMVMDTRPLKYYYRVLPDKRLLFGGRGAIEGRNADNIEYQNALQHGLESTFPQLRNLTVEHFWSGWVAVSFDDYPRIYHDKDNKTLYSSGYCGAGLAFSILAGKRIGQLFAEPQTLPNLPFWQSPLKSFPLTALRRPALRTFYGWEKVKRKFGY
jgi:glycine/D-amino acid oxidase-like deaminating enzyme